MSKSKRQSPTPIRLPQVLRDWLSQRAAENHRSLNGEVLHRLEQSRAAEDKDHEEVTPQQ